jgi:hypothetical protein
METRWVNQNESNQTIREGFDMFGDDYFKNVKRKINIPGLADIIKEIQKYLNQYGNPVTNIDQGIENFVKEILVLMVGQVNCNTGALSAKSSFLNGVEKTFTWANGQIGILNSEAVEPGLNILENNAASKGVRYAYDVTKNKFTEGFSIQEDPQLKTTIQSFMTNHPKITDMTALTTFYITQLNKYEASIGANPTTDQLFVFNNEFDNDLENADVLLQIQNIASARPKPSFPNTLAGYKSFMTKKARFSFDTSPNHEYTFFPLNIEYFPYPTNLAGFEAVYQDINAPNFIAELNAFLSNVNTPSAPPTPPANHPTGAIDPNYAYSINLTATQTSPVISYLDYITQFFAFIVYYNQPSGGTISYPTIQANIFAIYTEYLNAVEFEKYRVYSTYLTPYEVAMFNHLFFICLHQDDSMSNIYNIAVSPLPDLESILSIPSPYIDLPPQSIYHMIPMLISQINRRLPYLSSQVVKQKYQPLPMDGVLKIPDSTNKKGEPILPEYIVGISYEDDIEVPPVKLSPAVVSYYIPPGLAECEKENQNIQNECQHYAKIMKNELYRLLTIPIILYIIYNAYYLFFFKDCLSLHKEVDSNGNNKYRHSCQKEANGTGGNFTPIFPDWETSFHSLENHKTDFFFEFIFKPVKLFYTFLNSIKALFRKTIGGSAIKDKIPYIFFLFTFVFTYWFIQKQGGFILKMLYNLVHLKTPDFHLMKGLTLKSLTKLIIIVFFIFSFLKNFAGISFFGNEEENEYDEENSDEKEYEGNEESEESEEPELNEYTGEQEEKEEEPEKKQTGGKQQFGNINFKGLENKMNSAFKKMKNFKNDKTWAKWLFIPSGALITVIKWICAILYWVFKYIISIGLTTFSMFIFVVYMIYTFIYGISSYTTPNHTVNDKIELINRVIYSKLCDTANDGIFKYTVKSIIFFIIFFLTEAVVIHNLLKGMNEFKNMPKPRIPVNHSLAQKTNDSIEGNNLAIKSSMLILYGIIISIVGLWSVYKFKYKLPPLIESYRIDGDKSKKFIIDDMPDEYEEKSKNKFLKTLLQSDSLNKIHNDEFKTKTAGMIPISMISGFISKMGTYTDSLNKGFNSMISKAGDIRKNISFGQKEESMMNVLKSNVMYHTKQLVKPIGN